MVEPPTVAAVSYSGSENSEMMQLRKELTRLSALVASLSSKDLSHRGRSPSRFSRHRRRSPSPVSLAEVPLCWYHEKYGAAAKKCREPCSWGKLPGRTIAVTNAPGFSPTSRLFYVTDVFSGMKFLVDTLRSKCYSS